MRSLKNGSKRERERDWKREREREREYREKRSRELTDSQIKDFFKFGSSIWNLGNFEI